MKPLAARRAKIVERKIKAHRECVRFGEFILDHLMKRTIEGFKKDSLGTILLRGMKPIKRGVGKVIRFHRY